MYIYIKNLLYNLSTKKMKKSEFRSLIREEIKRALAEEETFGSEIEKKIQAERLAQQRAFIAWAKAEAATRNVSVSFQGQTMIVAAITKLVETGILTMDLLEKWKSSPSGSKENDLYQGLSVLFDRYSLSSF